MTKSNRTAMRSDANRVVDALENLCLSSQPGDRIPTRSELMLRFGASERAVMHALGELHRRGRVIPKVGAGTFVAGSSPARPEPRVDIPAGIRRPIIVVTQPDNSYFSRCLEILYHQANVAEMSVMCRLVDPAHVAAEESADSGNGPLGYLLFGHTLAPYARRLLAERNRVVLIGSPPAGVVPDFACIYGDHEQGAYLAAKHLIDLGHKQIGFVHDNGELLMRTLRWAGHQQAILEASVLGNPVDSYIISRDVTKTWLDNPASVTDFFRKPGAPTALVCWNDHDAVTYLTVLLSAGIRVPEEVSLIGYDDLPIAADVRPQLTTIDHSTAQQLRLAVRLLSDQDSTPSPHTVVVTPSLVRRGTTSHPGS